MKRSPKKSTPPLSEPWKESMVITYLMVSFVVGMVTILLPLVVVMDCEVAKQSNLVWPLSHLVKYKCDLTMPKIIQHAPSLSAVSSPVIISPAATTPAMDLAGKLNVFVAGYCIKKIGSTSVNECGEDAFALSTPNTALKSGRTVMGVADGVGGWNVNGGDSSKVSAGFLEELKRILNSTRISLSEAARLAFDRMAAQHIYKQGSTTVCASIVDHETDTLHISNVGDSGAFVFRDGKTILKTKVGVEGFNSPYQIGFDQEGKPYGSYALMETRYSLKLLPGDIIVLATDGVLDNLYEEELIEMTLSMAGPIASGSIAKKSPAVGSGAAIQERVKSAATTLAWHAWARSQEAHWISPFAQSAVTHGFVFSGGYLQPSS